jgi:hypothetical protein
MKAANKNFAAHSASKGRPGAMTQGRAWLAPSAGRSPQGRCRARAALHKRPPSPFRVMYTAGLPATHLSAVSPAGLI